MSFIPSKLGLRTHPLTQINLALVRVAGEKIYAQFAALLSDPNYGPSPRAGRLNNKRCVVLLLLSILVSPSQSFMSGWKQRDADALALNSQGSVMGLSSYCAGPFMDHQHCPVTGLDGKHSVCGVDQSLLYFIFREQLPGCFNGQVSELKHRHPVNYKSINPAWLMCHLMN